MHNPASSRYGQHLKDLADEKVITLKKSRLASKKKSKKAPALDKDEIAAGRVPKKRKREAAAASESAATAPGEAGATTASASATPTAAQPPKASAPGLSSGLSQNTNGSEKAGRKAREEFVAQSLNSATAAQGTSSSSANPDDASQSPGPPGTESSDTEMADRSDQSDQSDQSDDDDEDEDDIEGETPGETAYSKRLRQMYDQHPDKETQKALLAALEKLSQESDSKQGQGKHGKRGQRGTESDSPWKQDEEYCCTDSPRRRAERRVALSGYVRLILGQLLKLEKAKSPLPHGPPPEIAAPTAANFYIKWNESEKSEFNAIAARIVALRVVADYPNLCEINEMHDMVTTHIKYLRARYRRQTIPEYITKESQRLRAASAGTRKRTLYQHRLRIINAIPALRRHGRLIETLGLEGTSSDEEDATRPGVYLIKRRRQLSRQVNLLKDQLDKAFSIYFKGPGSKGNRDRKRVEGGPVNTRRLRVTGLPLSCMDPAWLATLTDIQKGLYEFRDMQYDFTFPLELLDPPEGW
ncbi:hypothetical protein FRC12_007905 [Ceratobasidium sp. 428]|nr:hypothetical protein FRC12_007905 [Ceratobasidium sp. 428]